MSIHHRAMRHLHKSKALIEKGDADSIRYSALELRYAIEHLFYGFVPHYKLELPDNILDGTEWRPGEIIDMIADIDPMVQHDSELRMGPQPAFDVPATQMFVVGKQTGISKDLVRKVYHKLGFYLHARTDRENHDPAHLKKRLLKFIPYLERYENDTVISAIAERIHFACQACGRPIAKRTEHIERDRHVRCPNRRCGAIYEFVGDNTHKLLQYNHKCEVCGADNWLDVHRLEAGANTGASVICNQCNTKYRLCRYVLFQRIDVVTPSNSHQREPPTA
jgi:DNA-directed RNA polymerase subunit RPC12/RpoP